MSTWRAGARITDGLLRRQPALYCRWQWRFWGGGRREKNRLGLAPLLPTWREVVVVFALLAVGAARASDSC